MTGKSKPQRLILSAIVLFAFALGALWLTGTVRMTNSYAADFEGDSTMTPQLDGQTPPRTETALFALG